MNRSILPRNSNKFKKFLFNFISARVKVLLVGILRMVLAISSFSKLESRIELSIKR